MFNGIAQQEREAEEEQYNPQFCQRIALHKPARQRGQDAAKGGRPFCRRDRRRFCFSDGRFGTPGIDRCVNGLWHQRWCLHWRGGLHRLRRFLSYTVLLKRLNALAKPGDLLPRRRASIKAYHRKHGGHDQRKNQEQTAKDVKLVHVSTFTVKDPLRLTQVVAFAPSKR